MDRILWDGMRVVVVEWLKKKASTQEQLIIQPSKKAGCACTKEQMMCAQSGETRTGALTARVRHLDSIWSTVGTMQELEPSCIILNS